MNVNETARERPQQTIARFRLQKNEAKELAREARRRMKEERLRKKERKLKRKKKMDKECLSEKMNCFSHDNEHWRTPPLWTGTATVSFDAASALLNSPP